METREREAVIAKVTNPENIDVMNPYTLAHIRLRQWIDWCSVDSHEVLEMAFDMPYEELFDPIYGSPLYPQVKYNKRSKSLVRKQTVI